MSGSVGSHADFAGPLRRFRWKCTVMPVPAVGLHELGVVPVRQGGEDAADAVAGIAVEAVHAPGCGRGERCRVGRVGWDSLRLGGVVGVVGPLQQDEGGVDPLFDDLAGERGQARTVAASVASQRGERGLG